MNGSAVSPMRFDYTYTDRGEVYQLIRYATTGTGVWVATTLNTYDDAGRKTKVRHTITGGTIVGNYTYTYDAIDRMTEKLENAVSTTFVYDTASQLTQDGTATFGYDATGNRTNTGYDTDPGNRLANDGVWTYTYDAEGNITNRSKGGSNGTWTFTYDHNNQMLAAAYSAGGSVTQRVTYAYDAWGNQIQRQEWTGGATSTVRLGLDGWDPAKSGADGTANFDVWARLDGSNSLVTRFAHGPGIDQVQLTSHA